MHKNKFFLRQKTYDDSNRSIIWHLLVIFCFLSRTFRKKNTTGYTFCSCSNQENPFQKYSKSSHTIISNLYLGIILAFIIIIFFAYFWRMSDFCVLISSSLTNWMNASSLPNLTSDRRNHNFINL